MVGGVVALDPEGCWQGSQRHVFYKHWMRRRQRRALSWALWRRAGRPPGRTWRSAPLG